VQLSSNIPICVCFVPQLIPAWMPIFKHLGRKGIKLKRVLNRLNVHMNVTCLQYFPAFTEFCELSTSQKGDVLRNCNWLIKNVCVF